MWLRAGFVDDCVRNCRYADILAGKLHQQVISVEKSRVTRNVLKEKIVALKAEQVSIKPEIVKLIKATKELQGKVSSIR